MHEEPNTYICCHFVKTRLRHFFFYCINRYALLINSLFPNYGSKNCKFKYDKSSADIRIGDLWGKTYAEDEKGVSAAIAFTEKGERVISATKCELKEHPFETVAEGQMKKNIRPAHTSWIARMMLRSKRRDIPNIWLKIIFILERIIRIPERIQKMLR